MPRLKRATYERRMQLQNTNASKWSYGRNVNEKFGNFNEIRQTLSTRALGKDGKTCLGRCFRNVQEVADFLSTNGDLDLEEQHGRKKRFDNGDLSVAAEVISKTIRRILFSSSKNGWDLYEKSDQLTKMENGKLVYVRYAVIAPSEYNKRHGTGTLACCTFRSIGDDPYVMNKKNYNMDVKRCEENVETLGTFVGVIAHEVAHEIAHTTFQQRTLYNNVTNEPANYHDEIWYDILNEIHNRFESLGIQYVACFDGLDLETRNH